MSDNNSDANDRAKSKQEPLSLKDLVITSTTEEFGAADTAAATTQPTTLPVFQDNNSPPKLTATPAAPLPSAIPVTLTRLYHIKVEDDDNNSDNSTITIPTHCFVQLFGADSTVVIGISQGPSQKIGNYLLCQADPNPLQIKAYQYQVSHLLGGNRDDTLLEVYAKRLAEVLVPTLPSPLQPLTLVLGISLLHTNNKNKNISPPEEEVARVKAARSPEVFRSVVDVMSKLYVEAMERSTNDG